MLRPTFRLAAELGFAPRPSGFRDWWTTVIPLSNNLEPSPEVASGSSLYECEVLLIERRRQNGTVVHRLANNGDVAGGQLPVFQGAVRAGLAVEAPISVHFERNDVAIICETVH